MYQSHLCRTTGPSALSYYYGGSVRVPLAFLVTQGDEAERSRLRPGVGSAASAASVLEPAVAGRPKGAVGGCPMP